MRVLLLAMPDTADTFDLFVRMPNLGIASLAAALDGHEVRTADLVCRQRGLAPFLERQLQEFPPDLVGLSAMTFQFPTLLAVARFIRRRLPAAKIVAGGYHATVAEPDPSWNVLDFAVRGEGEATLRELADALEEGKVPADVAGLSRRAGEEWIRHPDRPLLAVDRIPLPRRDVRVKGEYHVLGRPVEVVEASRGCRNGCRFCSISAMYGRSFRPFPVERVLADVADAHRRGARAIFFADDNIAQDVDHFRELLAGLRPLARRDLWLITQISAASLDRHPDLAAGMAAAGFRIAFVGFETMRPTALRHFAKSTSPGVNGTAARRLRENRIAVIAGHIVGNPDEDAAALRDSFRQIKAIGPDALYTQYLTPYLGTPLREDLLRDGLVENADDFRHYHGFACNVRTRRLSSRQVVRHTRWQSAISNLDPRMVWGNRLVALAPLPYVGAIFRTIFLQLNYSIRGHKRTSRLFLPEEAP